MTKSIGFIGLGHMGFPMAKNLLNADAELTVYNRPAAAADILAGAGALVTSHYRVMAENCSVIGLSLPGPEQVKTVVQDLIRFGQKGLIILDFSTVSPGLSIALSEEASRTGIIYIDIPVSGGPQGAASGSLSLMIGADEEEFTKFGLRTFTDLIGKSYYFMNKRGGGSAIKLINNFLAFSTQILNGCALVMADSLGISTEIFFDAVSSSTGSNRMLTAKREKVTKGDFTPGFSIDLAVKDLLLAQQLCLDSGLSFPILQEVLSVYQSAGYAHLGKDDSSAVIQYMRDAAKQDYRPQEANSGIN